MKEVFVSVPASSGNIGPGFDVLGMAVDLRNELRVQVRKGSGQPVIRIVGEGEDSLPRDSRHLIYQLIKKMFAKAKKPMPSLEIICVNRIPLARGLGSSSAAILSALLAGNRLLNNRFSAGEILAMATKEEGHPDNVAPALLGGVQASGVFNGSVTTVRLPLPSVGVVVAIPDFQLSTKKARKILPKSVSMKDAIFNLSAVALLPHALSQNNALLGEVLNDRWHEPYRAKLIPGFYQVKKAALKAGAHGMILSGAGPTLLAFVPKKKTGAVSRAMSNAFKKAGVACKTLSLKVDQKGALVK